MPTKTPVKKAAAKKAAPAKKTTAKVREVDSKLVTEVFSVTERSNTIEVTPGRVALFVNGNSQGVVDSGRQTIGEFAIAQAQRAGVRSFSVYLDGRKIDTSDAKKPLTGVGKVEIVAKDARGSSRV